MTDATAFQALTEHLAEGGYAFVCPSPETQGRVVKKRVSEVSTRDAKTAQDFFGWNLSCTRHVLASIIPDDIFEHFQKASVIKKTNDGKYRSDVRVSNFYLPNLPCGEPDTTNLYYIHSSFPLSSDSVFFGPDTYLFIPFLGSAVHHLSHPPTSIIDVCCGSGAGAIHLARQYPSSRVLGLDLNPRALDLGAINAHLASTPNISFLESNLYNAVPHALRTKGIDLIVSNPPYIASSENGQDLPIYADGGAGHGLDISIRIIEEGMKILSSQGVIIVYTGVAMPIANPGHDAFLTELKGVKDARVVEYRILHPDMWPEEIGRGAYADVCRIQVVGAVLKRNS
ncbi:S-adenosyl-L-methionine-dependent methyltransferase [Plenodomus tracheiphilus IPT5]|uniref:S-adenosyl-L-methionine-dependent methyltransferase n=1 Tax=Plenodomus tracheiphilus IPT5 TaxID=1408161 RepID=A0A6A7BKZ0_9PLEO|nr:S-adenosyl-L-methionine-dependent methyltransferase [Plenodomus tracheiphilus IPT5]